MRLAVIIITYTSAAQIRRFIEKLNNGYFDFYIHLDLKVDLATHAVLMNMPNVFFVQNRVGVNWGGYTTMEATLNSLRELKQSGRKYDFVHLVTGQDYPIKAPQYIMDFCEHNKGKEFINYKFYKTEWNEGMLRIERYYFNDIKMKGRFRIAEFVNSVMPKRKFPYPDWVLCGNETFWSLSQECAQYVVDVIDNDKKLENYLRLRWAPDEFVFQTVLMNSPFKDRIVNNNYRFINWPEGGGVRPNFFMTGDFERIRASEALFARKFDMAKDHVIFDLIDENLLK